MLADVHPDDRPALERGIASLRGGERTEVVLAYRTTHRDGREVWIESSVRISPDPVTGEPDGVVTVSRDIGERKASEARLTALASTDGLTGLANRRRLDEAIPTVLHEGAQGESPVSVLLIDVDHFKAFNDGYGHQAGDECLRRVAQAVSAAAQRSGGLAARYGGEELAILLPATGQGAAIDTAEGVRRAVEALACPHRGNSAAPVVTVSIGVATASPASSDPARASPSALVEAADAALYDAKRRGRNRVSSAPLASDPLTRAA